MAYDFNKLKGAWDKMTDEQRNQYSQQYKDNADFQRFTQEYNNAGTTTTDNQNGDVNNNQGTNTASSIHNDPIYFRDNGTNGDNSNNNGDSVNGSNGDRTYYNNNGYSSDGKNGNGGFYGNTDFDKEETLDKSMFNEAPGKITIEAGKGKETGRPDYEIWDATREAEMKHNLDEYYDTMPRVFNDRDTFNKFFEYNKRESDAQRELLDSYWKKKQDANTASTYTNADMLNGAFDNGDVTPGILDAIKQGNMELYIQWQKKMQDDLNARIANLAIPRTATDTAEIWQGLVTKLGLEAGDPYQIYDNWVGRCEQLGVFNMNNQLSQYISEMEQVKTERTRAMQRTMSQGAGKKSQALINAEVSKTTALYDARFADLQNQYQATYNQRQQNLAIANQSAQMLQAQAQEDQRIFNNKLSALGFAMQVDNYRTPEQQAQLNLQVQSIKNDMDLLNTAQKNDLALYNRYATAMLDNQIEGELSNLDVEDPAQQRANLNRVVGQYFEQYGDIIERSQSQVVDDVLAYAKKNGISVGQALKENFIEPLQNKKEYQQAVKNAYGMNDTTTIKEVDNNLVAFTQHPDGTFDYQIIYRKGTGGAGTAGGVSGGTAYSFNNYTPISQVELSSGLSDFISKHAQGTTGGQCGEFVNDYLQSLGYDRLYTDPIDKKKAVTNSKTPTQGAIAVMDSKNYPQYGHVAIVESVNSDGTVNLLESNWGDDKKVHYRQNVPTSSIFGYFDPSKTNIEVSKSKWEDDPFVEYYTYDFNKLNQLAQGTKEYIANAFGGGDTGWTKFMEARKQYNEEVVKPQGKKEGKELLLAMAQFENMLIDNGDVKNGVFDTSYWMYSPRSETGSKFDQIKQKLKLNQLLAAKEGGATFGSMTEGEWKIIGDAATSLSLGLFDKPFTDEFRSVVSAYWNATYGRPISQQEWADFLTEARETSGWGDTTPDINY